MPTRLASQISLAHEDLAHQRTAFNSQQLLAADIFKILHTEP
jgi:hypothetical protein